MFFVVLFWFCFAIFCAAYCSFGEWTLHSQVMHKVVKFWNWVFDYPFRAHAITHHGDYKSDHTYHAQKGDKGEKIPMAWWNGPALILIGTLPFAAASYFLNMSGLAICAASVITLYYGTYEYIHWCMHMPRKRIVERSGIFFRLNGHHLLHHRYMQKNFNVVLPLADSALGTLLRRSPIAFIQAQGPAVPNVQPISASPSG